MGSVTFYISGKGFDALDVRAAIAMKAIKYGIGRLFAEYIEKDRVKVYAASSKKRLEAFHSALQNERLQEGVLVKEVTELEPYENSLQ